jgi:hypothetical protein
MSQNAKRQADDRDIVRVVGLGRRGRAARRILASHIDTRLERRDLHRRGRGRKSPRERRAMILHQMRREARERDMFEEQRLRQRPEHTLQPCCHIDDDDRVEAVFDQGRVGADAGRIDLRGLGQQLLEVRDGPRREIRIGKRRRSIRIVR